MPRDIEGIPQCRPIRQYVMKGLGKAYSGGREVLKDIWHPFLPGAKIGVLGSNGAGKSTLPRIMAGQEADFVARPR